MITQNFYQYIHTGILEFSLTIIITIFIFLIVKKKKVIWSGCLIFSLYLIVLTTIGTRSMTETGEINLTLFWTFNRLCETSEAWYAYLIIANILLFQPFGFSLTATLPSRFRRGYLIAAAGAGLSGSIELMQYFGHLGLCELDDILNNTWGCMLGYAGYILFRLLRKQQKIRRKQERIAAFFWIGSVLFFAILFGVCRVDWKTVFLYFE